MEKHVANASRSSKESKMPLGRRGLIVPQNTFLEDVIRRSDSLHESFIVGSAEISDYPVVYCSTGFSQLTGFSRSEVMKQSANASFLFGPSVKKETREKIQDAFNHKEDYKVEFIGRKKDGVPLWYLLHTAPIRNEKNKVVLFLVTVRDISEYKDPITLEDGAAAQKWVKLKRTIKSERNAFVVAFTKSKEEKNKIRIAQMMVQNNHLIPQYKQQIPKPPKWVILHYSTPRIVWDWWVLLFILYTVSAVPFVLCFDFNNFVPMIVIDCFVDAFFFADILANFHTSYVAQDGEIVTDLKQIRKYYLRTWFLADLITSLPYGLLVFSSKNSVMANIISFFKSIRVFRISRLIRKLDHFINYGIITLILCIIAFLLCAHWMACIFYLIARTYDGFHDVGWVAILARTTKQPFNITSDGKAIGLPTTASLYVSSLYYCLTSLTTIGFGNISPNTTAEKIFGCITMIIGALYYAVIFGQVTAIVHQAQKQSEKYHGLLDNIKSFQKLYKVPPDLSARILDYFMSTWALTKGVDTDEVLKQCPKDLQSDICIHLNRKVLYNNPAFGSMPMSVMRVIARSFCICHVAPGDRLVHEGDSLDVLYFVSHGSFEVKRNECVVGLLGQGDVFGDDVCNEVTVGKSNADVYALTYSDIHCIDRTDLRHVLMSYPESGFEFSRNLKLSYNLRSQTKRISMVSTLNDVSSNDVTPVDELPPTHPLPNRTMRLACPPRRGRRLSLVEELTQTIENDAIQTDTSEAVQNGNVDKSRPMSDVIYSDDKPTSEQSIKQEASLTDNGDNNIVQLKMRFDHEIAGLNTKLERIEKQLTFISRFVMNNEKADDSAKTKDSNASTTTKHEDSNAVDSQKPSNQNAQSSWLEPRSPAAAAAAAVAVVAKPTGEVQKSRSKTLEEKSKDVPSLLARHGRRKINSSSDA